MISHAVLPEFVYYLDCLVWIFDLVRYHDIPPHFVFDILIYSPAQNGEGFVSFVSLELFRC